MSDKIIENLNQLSAIKTQLSSIISRADEDPGQEFATYPRKIEDILISNWDGSIFTVNGKRKLVSKNAVVQNPSFSNGEYILTNDTNVNADLRQLQEINCLYDGISALGAESMKNCNYLSSIDLSHVKLVKNNALQSVAQNIGQISVSSDSVLTVDGSGFYSANISSAFLSNLTHIPAEGFKLSRIVSAYFPKIQAIHGAAFRGCNQLTSVSLNDELFHTSVDNGYGESHQFWTDPTETVLLGSIPALKQLSSSTLSSIGSNALRYCSIQHLDLSSVVKVADNILYDNSSVLDATLSNTVAIQARSFAASKLSSLNLDSLPASGIKETTNGNFGTALKKLSLKSIDMQTVKDKASVWKIPSGCHVWCSDGEIDI